MKREANVAAFALDAGIGRVTRLLYVLIFADAVGYALVVPLLPFAVEKLGAGTFAAGCLFASYSLFQMAGAPVLGALSDRAGRRALLLVSQAGSVLGFGLLLAPLSMTVLFLSRTIDGATAGNVSLLYASVLDHAPPERWGDRFAALGAASGAGILAGLLGGAALASGGLPLMAAVATVLTLACMLATAFAFPRGSGIVPRARLHDAWRRSAAHPESTPLRWALLLVLLATIAQTAFLLALPMYVHQVLAFEERGTLVLLASLVAGAALFQMAALPGWLAASGPRRVAAAAFAVSIAGGAGLSVADSTTTVVAAGLAVIIAVAALGPSLTSLVAARNRAPAQQVLNDGALMGLQQAVVSLGQLLGPLAGYGALAAAGPFGYGLACASVGGTGLVLLLWRKDR
jgi:MFS family permease